MKKIEAIISQDKFEELRLILDNDFEANGMTVTEVFGFGNQKGQKEYVRGQEIITTLLPKVSVTFIVPEESVEKIVAFISDICRTGEVGDGKIFIYNVEEVIRIRTGERGIDAI